MTPRHRHRPARRIDRGRAADAVRARLALPRARRHLPRRQAARASRRSAPSSSSGRTPRASSTSSTATAGTWAATSPRARQGRRDRLPVPRLALGRRRQVQGDPLRQADPAAGPHPHLADRWSRTSSCSSGTTPRATRRPRTRDPARSTRRIADEWTDWTWETLDIANAHCREIIDNVVDMAHFFYIHYAFPTYFKNVFEGHIATQYMHSSGPARHGRRRVRRRGPAPEVGGDVLRAVVHDQPARPRLQGLRDRGHPDQLPLPDQRRLVRAAVRPDRQEARGARRRRPPTRSRRSTPRCSARASCRTSRSGRTRPPIQNPLLCEEDGPVYQLRRWYEQFYVDVADVHRRWSSGSSSRWTPPTPTRTGRRRSRRTSRRRAEEDGATIRGAHDDRGASDGLLRPTEPGDLEDRRRYLEGTPRRGRVPGLPGAGAGQQEQRVPHQHPVDGRGGRACAEFARMAGRPGGRPVHESCPRLKASIERAVRDGALEVGAEDGY